MKIQWGVFPLDEQGVYQVAIGENGFRGQNLFLRRMRGCMIEKYRRSGFSGLHYSPTHPSASSYTAIQRFPPISLPSAS
jgi:hypothetical protein